MEFKEPFVGLVCERLCIKKDNNKLWVVACVDKESNFYKLSSFHRKYDQAKRIFKDWTKHTAVNNNIAFIKNGTRYKTKSIFCDDIEEYTFHSYGSTGAGWIFAKEILN